jgi:hypothetical protein
MRLLGREQHASRETSIGRKERKGRKGKERKGKKGKERKAFILLALEA